LRLSVQTLFLPRESIPYMEEWLLYHSLLGFDRFRLYDNTGSRGDISSPFMRRYGDAVTKYGLPKISKETTDDELRAAAAKICAKFDAELIPWPSPHYTNKAQIDAVVHHSRNDESDYTAFIDMDEYVVVGGNMGIKDFMRTEVEEKGFCGVRMSQQKMPHILREKAKRGSRVWELTETFEMETRGWAPKSILPTSGVVGAANIHEIGCEGRLLDQPDRSVIKINHYNTNEYQMHWLRANHKSFDSDTPLEMLFLGQSRDYSLSRFEKEMSSWEYVRWEEIL